MKVFFINTRGYAPKVCLYWICFIYSESSRIVPLAVPGISRDQWSGAFQEETSLLYLLGNVGLHVSLSGITVWLNLLVASPLFQSLFYQSLFSGANRRIGGALLRRYINSWFAFQLHIVHVHNHQLFGVFIDSSQEKRHVFIISHHLLLLVSLPPVSPGGSFNHRWCFSIGQSLRAVVFGQM